jgi:hypothetical protein
MEPAMAYVFGDGAVAQATAENWRWNYVIDISTKWHRSFFYAASHFLPANSERWMFSS